MGIGIVDIRSAITPVNDQHLKEYFKELEKYSGFSFEKVTKEEFAKLDFGLVFIATGGTEGLFLQDFDKYTSKPCYILTTGESNSLAASMEILSYLHQKGKKGEILHGDTELIGKRIHTLFSAAEARKNISGMKVGCVGKPSDWLIASAPDPKAYKSKIGIELVDITIDELLSEIKKNSYEPNEWTEKLSQLKWDRQELTKAFNVYGAFKRLADRYQLGAMTVRCFDLLDTVHTTGCLGLSILNASRIYGGCEGDVPAMISMIIMGETTGQPVFLCNANCIDTKNDEMIFAHCTIPTCMPEKMTLATHYESGIGVAIAGEVKKGDMTVFKASGDLNRYFVSEGEILDNLHEAAFCRTQLKVRLPDYSYFTKDPIANHNLICLGHHKEVIDEFFRLI